MHDYKTLKATNYSRAKVKANRKRKEPRPPRDWKGFFKRLCRYGVYLSGCAAALGLVALLYAGGEFLVYDAPFFRVETVLVENAERITAEQICDLSDIRRGVSMFQLDLAQIGEKLRENPWIASATVKRVFPRTVTINVTEYEPVAIINLGCLYYVSMDGTVFKPLEKGDKIDYPLLTGIEQQDILSHSLEIKQLLAGAATLLKTLSNRTLFNLGKISEVHIDRSAGYELLTINGGVPIRMGFDDYDNKLTRLERVFPELEQRLPVMQYIDLNAVDRVIVKIDQNLLKQQEG